MKLQPIASTVYAAIAIAILIVVLKHLAEFIEYFVYTALAVSTFLWAVRSMQETYEMTSQTPGTQPEAEQESESEVLEEIVEVPPQTEIQQETVAADELSGTDQETALADPWTDAVAEPMPTPSGEEVEEEPPVPSDETQKAIERQLKSLPVKNQRKTWSALCKQLSVGGGTKFRDASPEQKARFLLARGVTLPRLIKAVNGLSA